MTDHDQIRASFEELDRRAAENQDEALRGKIRAVVATWRHNRELYPGWVVAPWMNRASLFQATTGWIAAVAFAATEIQAAEQVRWLRELAWRLDTCLLPLDEAITAAAEAALKACGYFASSGSPEPPSDHEVGDDCIALSTSLLRRHRERGDVGAFEQHEARLLVMAKAMRDVRSHVAYERVLLHLGRLEWAKADGVLAAWQPPFGSPIWEVRRAALAAEMGDLDSQRLVCEALSTVQDALPRGPVFEAADFHLLSCEGWAITNVAQIGLFSSKLADAGRLEQLAAVHCDPFTTLERMRSILGNKRLAPPQLSRFLDEQPTDLQHAMQAARLIEVGGRIVRLGNQIVGATLLKASAKWMIDVAPERAIPILLRIGDERELAKALTPRVVSRLSDEQVASTTSILRAALMEAVILVTGSQRRSDFGSPLGVRDNRARDQVETALAGLCALCQRMLPSLLDELLSDLSRIRRDWTSGVWQVRMKLEEASSVLLRAMKDEKRSNHALDLLDQTLAGNIAGMPNVLGWPNDPFGLLLNSPPIDRSQDPQRWRRVIRDLIHTTTTTNNPTATGDGLLRCTVLHRLGALEPTELDSLKQAVWSQGGLAERFQLPFRFLLALPEAADGQAKRAVRLYVEALQLPRFALDFEGLERKWNMQGLSDYDLLYNVLALTRTPFDGQGTRRLSVMDWRSEEAASLLSKIDAWWDEEGRDFYAFVRGETLSLGDAERRFTSIVETITFLSISHPSIARNAGNLLRKLKDGGVETALAFPILALEDPTKADELARDLRLKMASDELAEVLAALSGAYVWFDDDGRLLPPLPIDLPREISSVIYARRQPGLSTALSLATRVILQHPKRISALFCEDLRLGLHFLRLETAFRRFDGDELRSRMLANERSLAIDLVIAYSQIADTHDTMILAWFADADQEPFSSDRSKLLAARALWTNRTGGSTAPA